MVRPDYVVGLTEEYRKPSGKDDQEGKKGHARGVKKTIQFFNSTLYLLNKNLAENPSRDVDSLPRLYHPIIGGSYQDLRKDCLENAAKHAEDPLFQGVALLNVYPEEKVTQFSTRIYELVKNHLGPAKREIYVSCDGCPIKVLHGLLFGASVFETSLPFTLAEKKRAFDFCPKL